MKASQATRTAAALCPNFAACCSLHIAEGKYLRGRATRAKCMLRMIFLWQSQMEVASQYHALLVGLRSALN